MKRSCQHASRDKLLAHGFQYIELFEVEPLIGIYGDLFAETVLQGADQVIFFAMQQFGNVGVDPQGDAHTQHITGIP
jgi:hypothetical protein